MKTASEIIDFNAILFCLYGLGFIFFPHYLSTLVMGYAPTTSSGIIDMRATYGGICLGFGLLLAYCARDRKSTVKGLWAVILVVGGMALGRLMGVVIDDNPNVMMYIFLGLEVTIVTIAVIVLRKMEDNNGPFVNKG